MLFSCDLLVNNVLLSTKEYILEKFPVCPFSSNLFSLFYFLIIPFLPSLFLLSFLLIMMITNQLYSPRAPNVQATTQATGAMPAAAEPGISFIPAQDGTGFNVCPCTSFSLHVRMWSHYLSAYFDSFLLCHTLFVSVSFRQVFFLLF